MDINNFLKMLNDSITIDNFYKIMNTIINYQSNEKLDDIFGDLKKIFINKTTNNVNHDDFVDFFDNVLYEDYIKHNKDTNLTKKISGNNQITLKAKDIFNKDNNNVYDHHLSINTDASSTIKIVKEIYTLFKDNEIDFIIKIPNYKTLSKGLKEQIVIDLPTNNLSNALMLIRNIKPSYVSLFKEPNDLVGVYDFVGYEYQNISGKISSVLKRSIISTIRNWSLEHKNLQLKDNESILSIISKNITLNELNEIINYIIKNDDMLIENMYQNFKTELDYENIDINHIYKNDIWNKDIRSTYQNIGLEEERKINILKDKYISIVDSEKLDEVVLDKEEREINLLENLEKNNLLDIINEKTVVYLNDGTIVNGVEFVNQFVIPSMEFFPGITVLEIVDKYVSKIEKNDRFKWR